MLIFYDDTDFFSFQAMSCFTAVLFMEDDAAYCMNRFSRESIDVCDILHGAWNIKTSAFHQP